MRALSFGLRAWFRYRSTACFALPCLAQELVDFDKRKVFGKEALQRMVVEEFLLFAICHSA